jgi:hypothetical protein
MAQQWPRSVYALAHRAAIGGATVKRANAADDLAELLRHASPDIAAANADTLAELRNTGALGGAAPAYRLTPASAPTEHDEQAALFAWADEVEPMRPELGMMFAIPNGGARHPAVGAMLKTEGVRAGVPDVFLAVRRGQWGGLFVEMKRADKRNHATAEQERWIAALRQYGYMAVVCYGCTEAQQAIMAYLQQEVQP